MPNEGKSAQRVPEIYSYPPKSRFDIYIGAAPPKSSLRETLGLVSAMTGRRVIELVPSTLNKYYVSYSPAMRGLGFAALVQGP